MLLYWKVLGLEIRGNAEVNRILGVMLVGLLAVGAGLCALLRAGPPSAGAQREGTVEVTVTPSPGATLTPQPAPTTVRERETRAVWVSRWDLQSHADVARIVARVADAHMNTIFFQVRGQADALYTPGLEPWSAVLAGALGRDPGWDPLAEILTRAHAAGIHTYAWVNAYTAWMGDTPPPAVTPKPMYLDLSDRFGNEWLQWQGSRPPRLVAGQYLWANPAHPAVADRVVAVCKDLLSRYPLDGLQLDYVRYAGRDFSLDPVSNQAYSAALARDPNLSRADWQRAQVTSLVQRVRDEALPVRPGARLTTTAWPVYRDRWGYVDGRDGYSEYYQDAQGWARQGLVAAIVPMLYGPTMRAHPERYEVLARDAVTGAEPGGVVLGIGADLDSFAAIAAQIDAGRRAGALGQAFFSYSALEEHNYWAALRDGPYRQPAEPNWP